MGLADDDTCPCCGREPEDDKHALTGYEATGAVDWELTLRDLWLAGARKVLHMVCFQSNEQRRRGFPFVDVKGSGVWVVADPRGQTFHGLPTVL